MELTLTVPEDLVARLLPVKDRLPQILELGLRQYQSQPPQFEGLGDVLELFARLPGPEDVLALRPSATLQERISTLVAKQRDGRLSDEEQREWQQVEYAEHLVRLAKANALQKRKSGSPS